jgi:hypothetical protein
MHLLKGHVVEGISINVRIIELTTRELANREIVKIIIAEKLATTIW